MKFTKHFFVSLICIISIFTSGINVYASTGVEKIFYNDSISYNTNKAQHLADFSAQWLGEDMIVVFFKLLDSYGRTTVNAGTAEINIMNDYVDVYKSGKINITDDWFYVYEDYCLGGVVIRDPQINPGENQYGNVYINYTLSDGTVISNGLENIPSIYIKNESDIRMQNDNYEYYSDYYGVPDFGDLFDVDGSKETKTNSKGGKYVVYSYLNVDVPRNTAINDYSEALEECGFISAGEQGSGQATMYRYVNNSLGVSVIFSVTDVLDNTFSIVTVEKTQSANSYGNSSTNGYYDEFPNVPDLGSVMGVRLTNKEPGNSGSMAYQYRYLNYSPEEVISTYAKSLNNNGFEFIMQSNEDGDISYTYMKNDTAVVFGAHYLYGETVAIVVVGRSGSNTSGGSSNVYYSEYPSVPDFGYISGATFIGKHIDSDGGAYVYDALTCDTDMMDIYINQLKKSGFTLFMNRDYPIYKKGNIYVSINIDLDYYTYNVIITYYE